MSVAPQTTLDLESILCEKLELKAKEVEKYFDFEEEDGKLLIKVRRDNSGKHVWIDSDTWNGVTNYVRGLEGAWVPQARIWEIPVETGTPQPKEPMVKPETPKELQKIVEPQVSTKVETKDEYDLRQSKEKLGALVPILTDAYGNIIDGFHRQRIDSNWPKVKIGHITDPVQLSMARLASNVCRRNVPAEEKTKLLANIADLTGWDAKEIADALGMSYRWVAKYLPQDFKDVAKAHRSEMLSNVKVARRATESPDPQGVAKSFESESLTPTVPVEKIDTGIIFTCPECGFTATHIHVKPSGKHKLEEVREF